MPRGFGLAVALCAAILAPVAVMSAPKEAGVSEQSRKQGMAEAPAVVQAAGLPCQVADARLVGKVAADKKKGTPAQTFYEVACQGAMGFLIQANEGAAPTAYSCVEADFPPDGSKPTAPCMLPGNMNPLAALQPALQKAGVQCLPEKARGVGQTKTSTYLEVACQGGAGYIMVASAPYDANKPVQAQNCLMYDEAETNIKCNLSDHAARLAVIDKIAASANNGCTVKDRRFVGMSKDNSTFYEASCQDGKGYIFKTDTTGALKETYECSKASQILGGCTLTDARQAQSEQAGLYTKLAAEAGHKCDVDKYALFPTTKPGQEVVELVCKDGSGAILMSQVGQKSQVLDCGRAPIAGYKCSLSKPEAAYASLTADLKRLQQGTTCEVSNSRVVGKTEKGTTYVEVACADKLKGYMIEYQSAPSVSAVNVIGCAFAGNCKLPGNT